MTTPAGCVDKASGGEGVVLPLPDIIAHGLYERLYHSVVELASGVADQLLKGLLSR